MATQLASDYGAAAPARDAAPRRYLIGPIADFWCFGGSALIILPLLLVLPAAKYTVSVGAAMMLVAYAINYPHFAHSYQIFYRGFRAKAFTPALPTVMRARYLFAGLAAPLLLAAFFALCFVQGDVRLLGYAGNAMALFVGWHYVKQGYGLLMVDCTLKRQFFDALEKRVLLVNSYAVWIASWAAANVVMANQNMWGIGYYMFDLPRWLVWAVMAVAAGTTGATAWMFAARWRSAGTLPANGVIAYLVSLYAWQAFVIINPLWMLVSPALHSLQYLAVVWRFQTNYERDRLARPEHRDTAARRILGDNPLAHLALFIAIGTALGYYGFWLLPAIAATLIPYNQALFGGTAFVFVIWVFINVHHYFIDNVMWRRDNPEAKTYLFG